MHGDGKDSDNLVWVSVLKPFAEAGYTIYSLSMPGYGKSTGSRYSFRESGTKVILDFMQALGIEKTIIMGRSVGGRTSIQFGAEHPNLTVACIL